MDRYLEEYDGGGKSTLAETLVEKMDSDAQRGGSIMQYPTIDVKQTARRIKFFMQYRHLNPLDIQKYLGLTCVQTVYRWLSGVNIPTVDNLYALSCLFGIKVDDMLVGSRDTELFSLSYKTYLRLRMYCEKLANY